MAFFSSDDKLRILQYLGYSASNKVYLENQLNLAYLNFGDAIVTRVQGILDKLDDLDTLQATYANDANSSLIKADVLEWNPSGRQDNLAQNRSTLTKQLSSLIGMPSNTGYQGTPLLRS